MLCVTCGGSGVPLPERCGGVWLSSSSSATCPDCDKEEQ